MNDPIMDQLYRNAYQPLGSGLNPFDRGILGVQAIQSCNLSALGAMNANREQVWKDELHGPISEEVLTRLAERNAVRLSAAKEVFAADSAKKQQESK